MRYACLSISLLLVLLASCSDDASTANSKLNLSNEADRIDPDRPPTPQTLYIMADMLMSQKQEQRAEGLFQRILKEYPDFMPAYNSYSELLMRQRRLPEAIKVLEDGLKKNENDPVLLNNLGMCWLIRAQYDKALGYFTRAAGQIPENTRYRANMAASLALMGRKDEAIALYRQILPEEEAMENIRILYKEIDSLKM